MRKKISELCVLFNLKYWGDDVSIDGLNLIGRYSSKVCVLSYVTSAKYKRIVCNEGNLKALIISRELMCEYEEIMKEKDGCIIISDNPEKDFYDIHDYLYESKDFYEPVVDRTEIAENVYIHPTAVIEENVIIEENVSIGAFSLVKTGTIIKKGSRIGNYTVIGSEGYQVLKFNGIPKTIRHCGGVLIDENAQIGDHCSVCNTMFDGFTRIGKNTKIDNYCQIAHYVSIGENVVLTPGVILVGSVVVEDNCYVGAGACVMNKVVIHNGATVGMGSVVMRDVKEGITVMGNPATKIF